MSDETKESDESDKNTIACNLSLSEAIVLFELVASLLETDNEFVQDRAESVLLEELHEGLSNALTPLFNDDWEHLVRVAREELSEK